MKALKLFVPCTILSCFIQACNTEPKTSGMNDKYSAGSYELNDDRKDTINLIDANGSKEGHWIVKNWTAETGRIKTEEGNYKNNKKEGYWKFFNKDGSLKDSIEFKHDVAITK